jgi:hypothetical protein
MRMSIVVFVFMPGLVHGFLRKLRIRKEEVRISAEPADDPHGLLSKQRVADEQVKSVATVLGPGSSLELFVGELKRCDGVLPE